MRDVPKTVYDIPGKVRQAWLERLTSECAECADVYCPGSLDDLAGAGSSNYFIPRAAPAPASSLQAAAASSAIPPSIAGSRPPHPAGAAVSPRDPASAATLASTSAPVQVASKLPVFIGENCGRRTYTSVDTPESEYLVACSAGALGQKNECF